MNFFTIGFVICGLNFNIGYALNYAIRLAGLLFMLGGIKETEAVDKSFGFSKFRPAVYISAAAAAMGLAAALAARFLDIAETYANILFIITGSLSFVTVMLHQHAIIKHMTPMRTFINDSSLIKRLDRAWRRFAVISAVSMICEAVGRIAAPNGTLHTYSGLLLIIARITAMILLCVTAAALNAARNDFNSLHRIEFD